MILHRKSKQLLQRVSLCLLFLSISSMTTAETPDSIPVRRWELHALIGHTVSYTDLSENRFAKDGGWAIAMGATAWIKPWLGVSADVLSGRLNGDGSALGSNSKYYYKSDLNAELTVSSVFQYGELVRTNGTFRLAAFATAGFGWVNCSPEVYKQNLQGSANYFIDNSAGVVDNQVDYRGRFHLVLPVGFGLKARFTERTSFQLAGTYRICFSDEVNGYSQKGSKDDGYLIINAGVAVQLGKQGSVLQWTSAKRTAK
ncbi:MAG: hypothetical protein ACKO1U_02885 [Bacteroidota bacterium]